MKRMYLRDNKGRFASRDRQVTTFLFVFVVMVSLYYFVISPKPSKIDGMIYASGDVSEKPVMLPASVQGFVEETPEERPRELSIDEVVVTAEVVEKDGRVTKIFDYLVAYGSPMPEIATEIVEVSDEFGVDPVMITSIFCQESSCGKACDDQNCTGYGNTDSGETENYEDYNSMRGMIKAYATEFNGYYKNCGSDIACVSYKYNNRESWRTKVGIFYNEITK